MRIPLNRVVAFAGPYVSVIAGGIAAWLVARANVLGIPGLDEANTATWIAGALTALLTAGLSWLGHSTWLRGHHIMLAADGAATAAAIRSTAAPAGEDGDLEDPDLDPDGDLPSDEEEFAAPPSAAPVQPSQAGLTGDAP